jgi:DNA-binding CsgD family transcriptional regulator
VKADRISIVEAAYDTSGDDAAWLRRLAEAARPHLDRGLGIVAGVYDRAQDRHVGAVVFVDVSAAMAGALLKLSDHPHTPSLYKARSPCGTSSEILGLSEAEALTAEHLIGVHGLGLYDVLGVVGHDPSTRAVNLCAPMPDTKRPTAVERSMWGRVAAHLAGGYRVRRALEASGAGALAMADAILSPSGRVAHANAPAQSRSAREELRSAARAVDRARGALRRRDEEEALDLWKGLVAGRWSLVDHFDSDGRRYVVAHKNDPEVPDPRALTMRERQVLAYVALGHSLKLLGYELGLSVSTIAEHRKSAMRKLGLTSQAEVVQLFRGKAS